MIFSHFLMKPGFYSLFRRGKFIKEPLILGPEAIEWKQRERFAASMIAFAMQYDARFKTHFLESFGCKLGSGRAGFKVLIEPDDWGDIVVENEDTKTVFVLELKIGAKLAEKQNPSKDLFGKPGGYGHIIKSKKRDYRITYITLENDPASWTTCSQPCDDFECRPATWKDLRRSKTERTPLENNLYDTLGNLGVRCFHPIIANHMKLGKHAKTAVQLDSCLNKVSEELKKQDIPCKPHDIYEETEDEEVFWYYGVKVPAKPKSRLGRAIKTTTKGHDKMMAWFGYQGDPTELAVYFYSGKDRHQVVSSLLKTAFPKCKVVESTEGVQIGCAPEDSQGDFDWFTRVFAAVLEKKSKSGP